MGDGLEQRRRPFPRRPEFGEVGKCAVGHGGANGWVLWPSGDVLSTVTRSFSSLHVCGHDGDMAGGVELSAVMANGVWGQLEQRD